jgi:hypothetical protein
VLEIVGAVAVGAAAFTLLTSWLPGVGVVIAPALIVKIMTDLGKAYARMNAAERKNVRAMDKRRPRRASLVR